MLTYDLRLVSRHLLKRKLYSTVILLSLAVGFACSTLLLAFLISELQTDRFHPHRERSFQVMTDDPFGDAGRIAYIPDFLPEYLQTFPEVQTVVQVGTLGTSWIETEAGAFNDIQILSVDTSFFQIFGFPLTAGTIKNSLGANDIMLSVSKARSLFGSTDVVGRTLSFKTADTTRTLQVSAVLAERPENSHLVFDALVSHEVLKNKWNGGASYVLLKKFARHDLLAEKINKDPQRPSMLGPGKAQYFLESIEQSYFNSINKMTYMRTRNPLFIKIAIMSCVLVLFMAAFNFISLFLLSLQGRNKETGVKKVLGVSPWGLMRHSAVEASVYMVIAALFATLIIFFILPAFNLVVEGSLGFKYLSRLNVISWIIGVVFAFTFIVVYLSTAQQQKARAVSLMRNARRSKVAFSRTLFTVQFIVSITLAICAITTIRQMNYLENEPLGFNKNIIRLQSPSKSMNANLHTLKTDLLHVKGIQHASVVSGNPVSGNFMVRYDLPDGTFYSPFLFEGDDDMFATLDLTLLEGDLPSASKSGKVVNETLIRKFNLKNPIGEKIPGADDRIIGVVKDFTCTSFKDEIPPAILSYSQNNNRLIFDYSGQSLATLIPQVEKVWKKHFPNQFFSYLIIQEELMKKYKEETFFYKTVVTFSITTLVMSCFGLFALSWAVAESRTKEVGIRKVLGATVKDAVALLTKTFVTQIAIAFTVAIPVGYYLMKGWLDHFTRKAHLGPSVFIIAGALVILMALITMSIQTLKAARTNPVDELKNE